MGWFRCQKLVKINGNDSARLVSSILSIVSVFIYTLTGENDRESIAHLIITRFKSFQSDIVAFLEKLNRRNKPFLSLSIHVNESGFL